MLLTGADTASMVLYSSVQCINMERYVVIVRDDRSPSWPGARALIKKIAVHGPCRRSPAQPADSLYQTNIVSFTYSELRHAQLEADRHTYQ